MTARRFPPPWSVEELEARSDVSTRRKRTEVGTQRPFRHMRARG